MSRFILIRLFHSLITLIVLSIIVFGLVRFGGDPVLQFLSSNSDKSDYELIRARLGLDKPIYVQYYLFLANAVKGDLGTSIFTKRPVWGSIKEMLPNSLRLVAVGGFIGFMLAIPLGVMAAVEKGKLIDTLARILAGLGQSLPSFWVGLMMIQVFVVLLGVLPSSGMGSWRHYLMPATCLALFMMPGPIRLIRSSMLEVMDREYIKLAKIKGVPKRIIVWKHALRNSLLPVLSFSGMYLAMMVTGAITIETVFAWPGMGRLAYRAIVSQDFPVMYGVVMVTAVIVLMANFLVDIIYVYVDPRIRVKS